MTEYEVPPHQVPGWTAALAAIDAESEPGDWQRYIRPVTVALAAAVPHIRAETLADLSDELAEVAPEVAEMLDNASHEMRKALTQ